MSIVIIISVSSLLFIKKYLYVAINVIDFIFKKCFENFLALTYIFDTINHHHVYDLIFINFILKTKKTEKDTDNKYVSHNYDV